MRKNLIILALLSFSASGAFALTLEDAVSKALENNISIKREKITLEAAERTSKHSWNTVLPSLSVSANDEISLPEKQNNFRVEGKAAISISSDFVASIKKAQADYEAARISYEEAVSEILSQVKTSYFSLIYEKENLDYLRENLENAKRQAEQNEERFKRGTLSELEYLSSKVAYEKLKPELKVQEITYKNNLKAFCLILGMEDVETENQIAPEGTLEFFLNKYTAFFNNSMIHDTAENVRNGHDPSLQLLEKQLEASKKEVTKIKLSVWGSSVNLSYSLSPVLSGDEKGGFKQSAAIGLSLPLENLLPFSQGADSIKTAEDSVKDLKLQLEEKSKSVSTEFSSILTSLEQKKESISTLKDFILLAQKNYSAAQYSYSKGTMELLSLQNAAKENLEAKLNLQNEFLENLKLYISLEKLCGKNALMED